MPAPCKTALKAVAGASLGLLALLLAPPMLIAQAPPASPPPARKTATSSLSFETVSVKRSKQVTAPWSISSPSDGDFIAIANMSPRMLIGLAFDLPLHDSIYGLPGWADREAYDVLAKVPGDQLAAFHALLPRQRNPMLQKVLESRFHLKYHYETKTLQAYALVVAKSGPRMIAAAQSGNAPSGPKPAGAMRTRHGEIVGDGVAMSDFVNVLSQQVGRPVSDQTGLNGNYNFKLDWSPETGPNSTALATDDSGPSLFTALREQLGLKLSAAKVPVRALVVDHIDRPDQN